jgi:hypothetical protein
MAMMLRDTEMDAKPPLESALPRPAYFHVYSLLASSMFSNERVFLPFGLEDATNIGSIEASAAEKHRLQAPFPVAPVGQAAAAAAARQQPSSAGLRPMYAAFMAANWIVHYDPRLTPKQFLVHSPGRSDSEMIAHSMLCELKHAAEVASAPANALGRSTNPVRGPHESQRSRRIAATLLLPRALSGKTSANSRDIAFLNAFALIATSTNEKQASLDADGVPHQTPTTPTGGKPALLTNAVRMSVVVGQASVVGFAKTTGIASEEPFCNSSWTQHAILCLSYVAQDSIVHLACVLDDSSSLVTTARFVRIIQNAAFRAQFATQGQLVLPHGFVAPEYVAVEDEMPGHDPDPHFLRIQAEKQREFQRLHVNETTVDVPTDVVKKLDFEFPEGRRARFARICSNKTRLDSLCDERHCPGVLFSSNEELAVEYLNRNRIEFGQRDPFSREWPPYGLSPPRDEERQANICLLWFRIETHAVGDRLNVFFPRVLMGREVTDVSNSRIFAVVPTLCAVESVVYAGNFVLPCTYHSMLPAGRSETSSRLYSAFCKAIDESFDKLRGMPCPFANGPVPLCHATSTGSLDGAASPSSPSSQADDDLVAALMSGRLGHPASTCGDAYELLQDHAASENSFSRAFHGLVATGLSKLGPHVSMQQLMDEAACALADRLSIRGEGSLSASFADECDGESDRKRSRTPNGTVRSPPPQLTNSLRQDSHASGLSEVSGVSIATAAPVAVPPPSVRNDSLRRHCIDDQNLKRIAALAGMKRFGLADFENGEVYVAHPSSPQVDAIEDLLDGTWKAYGIRYDIYEAEYAKEQALSERSGEPPTPTSLKIHGFLETFEFAFNIYDRVMRANDRDVVEDFETFALLRPLHGDEATLYAATRRNDAVVFEAVVTDALFQELTKVGRVLFTMTQSGRNTDADIQNSPTYVSVNVFRSSPDGGNATTAVA